MSGVAMATSKSILPFWISSARSSAPTMSAPASRASCGGLAGGEHGDADVLARACRQRDRAADHLVGLARVDAEAHRHVDGLVEPAVDMVFARASASPGVNSWSRSNALAASAILLA